jgi:hypothetical protein
MAPENAAATGGTLAHRARHELVEYVAISAYLYIYFAALLFFKAAILHGEGISYAPYGVAAVKAVILGKFILLGHVLKVGERHARGRLVLDILEKSLLFLVLLIALSTVEEVAVGLIHGRPISESITHVAGPDLLQVLATSLLMLLVLIPYFAFREIDRSLGEGKLLKLLVGRPSPDARS